MKDNEDDCDHIFCSNLVSFIWRSDQRMKVEWLQRPYLVYWEIIVIVWINCNRFQYRGFRKKAFWARVILGLGLSPNVRLDGGAKKGLAEHSLEKSVSRVEKKTPR